MLHSLLHQRQCGDTRGLRAGFPRPVHDPHDGHHPVARHHRRDPDAPAAAGRADDRHVPAHRDSGV